MKKFWKIALSFALGISLLLSVCSCGTTFNQSEELFVALENSQIERFDSVEIKLASGVTDLQWSSSNERVAVVEEGRIIAISAGETVLTARNGNQTQKQTIRVYDEGERPFVDLDYLYEYF